MGMTALSGLGSRSMMGQVYRRAYRARPNAAEAVGAKNGAVRGPSSIATGLAAVNERLTRLWPISSMGGHEGALKLVRSFFPAEAKGIDDQSARADLLSRANSEKYVADLRFAVCLTVMESGKTALTKLHQKAKSPDVPRDFGNDHAVYTEAQKILSEIHSAVNLAIACLRENPENSNPTGALQIQREFMRIFWGLDRCDTRFSFSSIELARQTGKVLSEATRVAGRELLDDVVTEVSHMISIMGVESNNLVERLEGERLRRG